MPPLSSVQPARATWAVELVDQRTESGIVLFEYAVRERGGEPFLLNNHKAQLRTNHQRTKLDGAGKMLHVSGVAVAAADLRDFIDNDTRAYRWLDKDAAGNWRDDRGRTLAPYLFPAAPWTADGDDELDPQWQREQFTLPIQSQIDAAILRYLDRAESHRWTGDKRGTTVSAQVGAGADDGTHYSVGGHDAQSSGWILQYGYAQAGSQNVATWSRFPSVSVPNAATIDSASLALVAWETRSSTVVNGRIDAEDSDDTGTPTHAEFDGGSVQGAGHGRQTGNRTTAQVTWNGLAAETAEDAITSPEIKTIIQELVDRAGWASGNDMTLYFGDEDAESTQADLTRRIRYDYESNTSKAPVLDIDYTVAGVPPLMDYYRRRRIA